MQRIIPLNQFHDDPFIYASLIKACHKLNAIRTGESMHCNVVKLGLDYNVNILNALVYFYSNLEKLIGYARIMFDEIPEKTVVTVNCMISGFLKNKLINEGLSLFNQVISGCYGLSLKPNYVTFVILICGCSEFRIFSVGKLLHSFCHKTCLCLKIEVGNALIDFYAKLGCMEDGARLFQEIPNRDLVSWNTMIGGYAKNNDSRKAFLLFKKMRFENITCDRVSFINLIAACANNQEVDLGKMIHGYIKTSGLEINFSIGIALINMYSKCKSIDSSRRIFEKLPSNNIASLNSMIHGYVACGNYHEALMLFNRIKTRNLIPDEVTMLGLIAACRGCNELNHGIAIHTYIDNNDHIKNHIVLNNALLDMYAKCGSMTRATSLFDKIKVKDVVSWTSMIVGHAINGNGKEAINSFSKMGLEKVEPNSITFIGVLLACDHAGLVHEGRFFYSLMRKKYFIKPTIEHCGCVVDMHARAGMLNEARDFVKNMPVEPNAVIWRMLVYSCSVYNDFDLGLSLVNEFDEVNASVRPENYVVYSKYFAEKGNWNGVLSSRRLMMVIKAMKMAGKSSIQDSIMYLLEDFKL